MSKFPLGILASAGAAPAGAFELIQTVSLASNTATVSFNSIPQTFTHLQIRWVANSINNASDDNLNLRVNGDTSSSYRVHEFNAFGTTAQSRALAQATSMVLGYLPANNLTSTWYSAGVADILNYRNLNMNRTIKGMESSWGSTPGSTIRSCLYLSASAASSITLFTASGASLRAGSRFSLFGIRG